MKSIFGGTDNSNENAKPEKPEMTAADWIIAQQMDPKTEAATLATLKAPEMDADKGPTAADWIRAQGMDAETERSMLAILQRDTGPAAAADAGRLGQVLGEIKTNTSGGATAADWIRAQGMDPAVEQHMMETIYGKAGPKETPAVESPSGTSKGAFVKGLIQKAFNFGSAKKDGAAPAVVATAKSTATVTASSPKQKTPGA